MKTQRILITGAGGFIGSHMVDWAVRAGHFVMALDKKSYTDWIKGNERPHFVWDRRHLPMATAGDFDFDVCYHLAAESRIQPSYDEPLKCVYSNVQATAAVLEACRWCNARMVYAGSSTADDDVKKNVYATTKYAGELLCQAWAESFGTSVSIARFYNVYGPRQVSEGTYATVVGIFEKQWREGKKLTVTGDGSQRRDFTHVDDIVSGLVAIAEYGDVGKCYGLGTGRNHSILDVARMFVDEDQIEFVDRPHGESEVTKAPWIDLEWNTKRYLGDYVRSVKHARIGPPLGVISDVPA